MKFFKFIKDYFTLWEKLLWLSSMAVILIFFFVFDKNNYLSLSSSIIGITSLILCAKGNPLGQLLMLVFSALYGIISFFLSYYGEMITYLGMSAPMALLSLISWIKNPFKGNKAEVKVNKLKKGEPLFLAALSVAVTIAFYFILKALSTADLIVSTFSVLTSFIAAYLTFRRSPYFALAYAFNDIVLIVLWGVAASRDISYLSVLSCFAVFLLNDMYSFINWQKMKKRQLEG